VRNDASTPLPGQAESCWVASAPATRYPRYEQSDRVDVGVVGGGIVGLTAAYLLTQAGYSVTVLEARRIGRQVTGRSTAKITAQHALIYAQLIKTLGVERARLYGEANHSAVELIAALARDLDIACDFERKDAYAYTHRSERMSAIEAEVDAARRLGFDAGIVQPAPLPFATAGALRFPHQAQFNPAQYLVGLAAAITDHGCRIFENTRIGDVEKRKGGKGWRVKSGPHHLDAENVVVATNIAMWGPIEFDQRLRPRCHTVMAFRAVPASTLDGMFIDIDQPSHSIRMGRDRDGPLLIVLGPSFTTGNDGDVAKRFEDLERWVRASIPASEVVWRWVNEDYDSPDRVPYAGELTKDAPGMYVATGFNGWGISNGTAAAMLIVDQVQGVTNPWRALYNPTRRAPKHFNRGGDSQSIVDALDDIAPGAGGVIEPGKRKIAVWKESDGKPHALSASCTHLGCTVTWNNADRTWDCPCHGSMFARDGEVIHGPATEPLKPARLPANDPKADSRRRR
jgi:glycine/D-amino acid oxidase-like deaminating enzyme/nitrite reductase/ring-hydroxylating ferredoxin subunit